MAFLGQVKEVSCEMKNKKSQKLLFLWLFIKSMVAMKKKSRVLLFCPGSEMPIVVILVPIMIDFKYFCDYRIYHRKIEQYNSHSG